MSMGHNKVDQLGASEIIGNSPAAQHLRGLIQRVARSKASVLICGPSGSGKELVARAIHNLGARSKQPFSAINCGAIPSELIESELFGHEKGAFTGATARRIGHFEASEGGSIFLDEIGDMRFEMQVKLLRVLEDRTIVRVGSSEMRPVDVRVISATHQNLDDAIADGRFREDLFFRLGVVVVQVPGLASRTEDIPMLIRHFQSSLPAEDHCRFDDSAMQVLMQHSWPGNVRELRNFVERASVLHGGEMLTAAEVRVLINPTAALAPFSFAAMLAPAAEPIAAPMPDLGDAESDAADAIFKAADDLIAMMTADQDALMAGDDSDLVMHHLAQEHQDDAADNSNAMAKKPAHGRPIDLKREIETIELEQIHVALDLADGIISEAARLLTLKRTTLIEKMRKYGVQLQAA